MSETVDNTSERELDFPLGRTGCPFDPPPEYRELRTSEPVASAKSGTGENIRLIARHADVRAALADPRISADFRTPGYPGRAALLNTDAPVFARTDPPEHTVHRRLLISDFTVRKVREMRPEIQRIVDAQLDVMAELAPRADLVDVFALPVPSLIICRMLGVPYAEHDFFQSRARIVVDRRSSITDLRIAIGELREYLVELLAIKRDQPGDDILTRLIREQQANGLSDMELAANAVTLLNAGHETTANMIALGVLVLLSHPQALAELKADADLWPNAVDELLRYLSIADTILSRVPKEDIEIGDTVVKSGEGLFALIGSANRDETVFPDPDRFDIHRSTRHHLAFGYGVHACLGHHLARAELEIALETLFRRFPDLRLDAEFDELPFKHDAAVFGVHSLPISW
ncbi:cytochrome P450 [Nocardia arthritidis]|uniref:Cytochrome P450 n=1 Tax=Nocardia arthritidis TaxID=228602 RepID=A0A6G9Y4D5_9NOCA|nr:cytochrome P450 [Nocardia arthritidis]QIS08062.1 cytochrome P450 [Nocardia arthritidis]